MRAEFLFFLDNLKGRGWRKPFLIFKSGMKRGAGALQKAGAAVFLIFIFNRLESIFSTILGDKGRESCF